MSDRKDRELQRNDAHTHVNARRIHTHTHTHRHPMNIERFRVRRHLPIHPYTRAISQLLQSYNRNASGRRNEWLSPKI